MASHSFNDNLHQTPSSTSALQNGAAKDDTVTLSSTGSFALHQILDNDPGSAIFHPGSVNVTGGSGSIAYDSVNQTFQVTGEVTSFEYMIRLANGTYSTATVTVNGDGPEPYASDLLFQDTFTGYTSDAVCGLCDLATTGWTGTTTNAEIVADGYQGIVGTNPDTYWLDTQGSPGAIDITHGVHDENAGKALISFTAAFQQFGSWVVTGALEFWWNGALVKSISTADFDAGNQFKDLSVVVDSLVDNTLEIRDTGTASYVGFALDSVTVNDWIVV